MKSIELKVAKAMASKRKWNDRVCVILYLNLPQLVFPKRSRASHAGRQGMTKENYLITRTNRTSGFFLKKSTHSGKSPFVY